MTTTETFTCSSLKGETDRFDVEILSWCLMTSHVHFVALPGHESSLAKGFGEAHKQYTRMKNFTDCVRGYLFQGRFSFCVLDERHQEKGVIRREGPTKKAQWVIIDHSGEAE